MFYALSWFMVFGLLALWSLAAWAFHGIAIWTVANAGALTGGAGAATSSLGLPDWLAPWVPPEFTQALDGMVAVLMPAVDALIAWAPTLAGGLSTAVWVVWALGSVILVIGGFVLTGIIAMLRRQSAAPAGPGRGLTAAG